MDVHKLLSAICYPSFSSTKQPNIKILSSESAGDVNHGAFGVLRVEFVIRDANRLVLTPCQPEDALPGIYLILRPNILCLADYSLISLDVNKHAIMTHVSG